MTIHDIKSRPLRRAAVVGLIVLFPSMIVIGGVLMPFLAFFSAVRGALIAGWERLYDDAEAIRDFALELRSVLKACREVWK